MTKFQKVQKFLSFIPFASSIFVFFVTMFELNRKKAKTKYWFLFGLIFFSSGIATFFLGEIPFLTQYSVLYTFVAGGVLAVANILCVELQIKCPDLRIKTPDLQEVVQPAKSKKPWIITGTVLFAVVMAVIAAVKVSDAIQTGKESQIPDTNGVENTNVVTITEDQVLQEYNTCCALLVGLGGDGSSSNVTEPIFKDYDYQSYSYRSKAASGTQTVHATRTENENLTLTIETELVSGNMEIFVLVDGQIYARLDPIEKQTVVLEDIAGKLVVVKFAAESAELSIQVTREYTP